MVPTGSNAQQDGGQVAAAFLDAWQAGDLTKAGNYTNHPAAAKAALATYAKYLNLGKFSTASRQRGKRARVDGRAAQGERHVRGRASVAAGSGKSAVRGTWAYHSSLVAYQQPNSSVWFVAWQPDVVAPNLTAATHLATVQVPPTVSMVTDAERPEPHPLRRPWAEHHRGPAEDTRRRPAKAPSRGWTWRS